MPKRWHGKRRSRRAVGSLDDLAVPLHENALTAHLDEDAGGGAQWAHYLEEIGIRPGGEFEIGAQGRVESGDPAPAGPRGSQMIKPDRTARRANRWRAR
jgi:hypothetical protein